ncbi:hypothetical protein [Mesorhizobium sp. M0598]
MGRESLQIIDRYLVRGGEFHLLLDRHFSKEGTDLPRILLRQI